MTFEQVMQRDQQYVAHTSNRFQVAIKQGKGATCTDVEGKEYIDFTSGIGVNALGYADEEWLQAVTAQLASLAHVSNLYYTEPCGALAEVLCAKTGMSKAFFCNSGAEANECAIKAARKYSSDKYGSGRHEIITLQNSFHGRTLTALSATGQDTFHQHYHPFTPGFLFAEANSIASLQEKLTPATCAVMLELIQGEGGVVALEQEYVQQVAEICKQKDILLVIDEIQTGMGRTGKLFCYEHYNIRPDLVTSAKALGGGLPLGAVIFGSKTANVFAPGDHGTTFGGNPAACAGGLVVLNRMNVSFLEQVAIKGGAIRKALMGCNNVESISGLGMMLGIALKEGSSRDIAQKCLDNGLLVLTAKNKIRLLPPLVTTREELDKGVQILSAVLR